MTLNEFAKYLELKEQIETQGHGKFNTTTDDINLYNELSEKLIEFANRDCNEVEEMLFKLRKLLKGYNLYVTESAESNLNKIKVIREVLDMINRYDWKTTYSEYTTSIDNQEVRQVAIWEQNSDRQIRNHKVWNIK